jgi:hypothetical protein
LDITSSSVVVAPKFDGSLFVARVQADLYPLNTERITGNFTGLLFNVEYSYRHAFEAHEGLESQNMQLLKLGATYFFVKGQAIGIGVSLDAGRSPDVNFIRQRRVVLALRLKTTG